MTTIRVFAAVGLLIAATSAWPSTGQERAEMAGQGLVGSAAPPMVVRTIDGQEIDLATLYGRTGVYLKFWATWCVPCREQMPHFERTYLKAGRDLTVIAVNAGFDDTIDDVRRYRSALGLTMPIVIDDGRLAAAFNLRVTPQHVVIGRDGRIQYVGHLADARLDSALQAARRPAARVAAGADGPKEPARIAVNDLLPDISPRTIDGTPFALHDANDRRPTVLVFLSPWCESYLATSRPAIAARCRAMRLQADDLSTDRRARWIGIASGLWATPEELSSYRKEHDVSIPLTLDASGALFRRFGVTKVPTVLVADVDGRLVGRVDEPDHGLDARLKALAAIDHAPDGSLRTADPR
jgi:peroxiredoxin